MGQALGLTMPYDSVQAKEFTQSLHRVAKSRRQRTLCRPRACNLNLQINGRGEEIRTPDILLPKQARYQTALHPDCRVFSAYFRD